MLSASSRAVKPAVPSTARPAALVFVSSLKTLLRRMAAESTVAATNGWHLPSLVVVPPVLSTARWRVAPFPFAMPGDHLICLKQAGSAVN